MLFCRTTGHTHPLDPTLIVTCGPGRVQRCGSLIEEIRPGDRLWFAKSTVIEQRPQRQ